MRTDHVTDETTDDTDDPAQAPGMGPAVKPEADRVTVVLQATYQQPDAGLESCTVRASRLVRVEASPLTRTIRPKKDQLMVIDFGDLDPAAVEVFMVNKTGYRNLRVAPNYAQLKAMTAEGIMVEVQSALGHLVSLLRPGRGIWLDSPGQLQLLAHVQDAVVDVYLFPF